MPTGRLLTEYRKHRDAIIKLRKIDPRYLPFIGFRAPSLELTNILRSIMERECQLEVADSIKDRHYKPLPE